MGHLYHGYVSHNQTVIMWSWWVFYRFSHEISMESPTKSWRSHEVTMICPWHHHFARFSPRFATFPSRSIGSNIAPCRWSGAHRDEMGGGLTSKNGDLGMDQYLLIPFLGGWTSIYQLFWCSPGVQGFDTLPFYHQKTQMVLEPSRMVGRLSQIGFTRQWWYQ